MRDHVEKRAIHFRKLGFIDYDGGLLNLDAVLTPIAPSSHDPKNI